MKMIFGYSRKQAIEDGVLVDVSEMAREAGFTEKAQAILLGLAGMPAEK